MNHRRCCHQSEHDYCRCRCRCFDCCRSGRGVGNPLHRRKGLGQQRIGEPGHRVFRYGDIIDLQQKNDSGGSGSAQRQRAVVEYSISAWPTSKFQFPSLIVCWRRGEGGWRGVKKRHGDLNTIIKVCSEYTAAPCRNRARSRGMYARHMFCPASHPWVACPSRLRLTAACERKKKTSPSGLSRCTTSKRRVGNNVVGDNK